MYFFPLKYMIFILNFIFSIYFSLKIKIYTQFWHTHINSYQRTSDSCKYFTDCGGLYSYECVFCMSIYYVKYLCLTSSCNMTIWLTFTLILMPFFLTFVLSSKINDVFFFGYRKFCIWNRNFLRVGVCWLVGGWWWMFKFRFLFVLVI